jgi:hypothetical protein
LGFGLIGGSCSVLRVYSLLCQGLAGIQPVDVPGIENVSSMFPIFFVLYCVSCLHYFIHY